MFQFLFLLPFITNKPIYVLFYFFPVLQLLYIFRHGVKLDNANVTMQTENLSCIQSFKNLTQNWKTFTFLNTQMKGEPAAVEGFYIRLQHIPRDAIHPHTSAISTPGARHGSVGRMSTGRHEVSSYPDRTQVPDDLESNSSVVTVLNAGSGLTSYILQGLHNYRVYTIFLVPFYDTFEGRPSNSRTFLTPVAGERLKIAKEGSKGIDGI